jgi:hypothetical protein
MHRSRLYFFALLILTLMLGSCKSQTANEKINITSERIYNAILKNDSKQFISLIAYDNLLDMGKNAEIVKDDVQRYYTLFSESKCKIKHQIIVTETYNFLAQKKVMISFCVEGQTSSKQEMHLNLLFGPSDFFSLDKITGYELIIDNSDSLEFQPKNYWINRN